MFLLKTGNKKICFLAYNFLLQIGSKKSSEKIIFY